MFHVPNQYRVRDLKHPLGTFDEVGNNGAFSIPFESHTLKILASDGMEWEHVSVSLQNRTPNWREMCFIKNLFWDPEDLVVQYHPPESEYVNDHDHVLHLWRPTKGDIMRPPKILV